MDDVRMGFNLGFIDKIVLVNGEVINNMQVLYRDPVPDDVQVMRLFEILNRASEHVLRPAQASWSANNFIPQNSD